ncbi:hypothetical protein G7Y89_g7139 [Cudoniella acicularis]|uniref:PITH domain-containing protein n=1 Tax=Cudoniella acicularis TaxID=354080 RepID=A0A8H4RJ55_9HELO|nr:hypothetical protein G7Y89_g7139 [Cudoniella acicularis]
MVPPPTCRPSGDRNNKTRDNDTSFERAVPTSGDVFRYTHIEHRLSIRLLLLQPGEESDSIHCRLLTGRMGSLPDYGAVSYTWADESGDDSKCSTIYLEGVAFQVTRNCKSVLKRVRSREETRTIWVDAICIDQVNVDERSQQVQLMPQIYSGAKIVLIYLGEPTEDECTLLEHIGRQPETLPISKQRDIASSQLFKRRYFTRAWVLQEINLAKELLVICGTYTCLWEDLLLLPLESGELEKSGVMMWWVKKLMNLPPAVRFSFSLPGRHGRPPVKLLECFDLARDSNATDSRDKIFAVLGMVSGAWGLVPNYTESVKILYMRMAVWICERYGVAAMLARTVTLEYRMPETSPPDPDSLPHWVPDWTKPMFLHEFCQRMLLWTRVAKFRNPQHVVADTARGRISFYGLRVGGLSEFCNSRETHWLPNDRDGLEWIRMEGGWHQNKVPLFLYQKVCNGICFRPIGEPFALSPGTDPRWPSLLSAVQNEVMKEIYLVCHPGNYNLPELFEKRVQVHRLNDSLKSDLENGFRRGGIFSRHALILDCSNHLEFGVEGMLDLGCDYVFFLVDDAPPRKDEHIGKFELLTLKQHHGSSIYLSEEKPEEALDASEAPGVPEAPEVPDVLEVPEAFDVSQAPEAPEPPTEREVYDDGSFLPLVRPAKDGSLMPFTPSSEHDLLGILRVTGTQSKKGDGPFWARGDYWSGPTGEASSNKLELSGEESWRGAELPSRYTDVTDQIEVRGCELLNADGDFGDVAVLFEKSAPSALNKTGGSTKDWVESGADDQLLLFMTFQSMIKLHTLQITSLPPRDSDDSPTRPGEINLYINKPHNLDFSEADDTPPTQAITLGPNGWNTNGTANIELRFVKFQNISTVMLHQAGVTSRFSGFVKFMQITARQNCIGVDTQTMVAQKSKGSADGFGRFIQTLARQNYIGTNAQTILAKGVKDANGSQRVALTTEADLMHVNETLVRYQRAQLGGDKEIQQDPQKPNA